MKNHYNYNNCESQKKLFYFLWEFMTTYPAEESMEATPILRMPLTEPCDRI